MEVSSAIVERSHIVFPQYKRVQVYKKKERSVDSLEFREMLRPWKTYLVEDNNLRLQDYVPSCQDAR